ncbi:GNAT family N-acetyltransferase [Pseudonocardiaceae bacterium YIM PH 21723]|nr:GNAT family N-acetyltransferase [Pseudonocardiaceae bacterium YIM PH 21723]
MEVRPLGAAEADRFTRVLVRSYYGHGAATYRRETANFLSGPENYQGIFDAGRLIGVGGCPTRTITLPGSGPQPVTWVTSVGVVPGERRRGALTALMRHQLELARTQSGLALLWSSEGGIYERFGFGMAALRNSMDVPHGAEFRPGITLGSERVRHLEADEALPLIRPIFDRVAPTRVGWALRADSHWNNWLDDPAEYREGFTPYQFAVLPNGYAVYKVKHSWTENGPEHDLDVKELVAADPVSYARLWRELIDLDQAGDVEYWMAASDEPVRLLLADPRAATVRLLDSLWVRLADLPKALSLRHYSAPVESVLEVTDRFCPWNTGRWRLCVDEKGHATVERTRAEPEVSLGAAELGAAFLGGTRLAGLAAAQRVLEHRPGTVAQLSRAFAGDRDPHGAEIF